MADVRAHEIINLSQSDPRTIILNYRNNKGILVYDDRGGRTKRITRPFTDIFNSINSKVLSANTDIILPNGCIYRARLQNGNESFLIQEQPGIRSFRISNKTAAINLVAKMYNKFEAQTRVLERNEVEPDKKEEVEKQIELRKKYLSQQNISRNDSGQHYKFFFRVFFPYSYILITIDKGQSRNTNRLTMNGMHAAISLEPINTLNDYVYQFPLSNVSQGGNVCTGQLPLGNYGHINVKSYVEKMTGYFWNNKFNADITAGPETYGDKNFLGNWFEWEFTSYVSPADVLSLDFTEEGIKTKRLSVGKYIYNSNHSSDDYRGKSRIHTINETSFVEGFEADSAFGDAQVDIENGEARKTVRGLVDSIELGGYDIPLRTIIKTENKKFKIISYDGFRTYNVDDSTLYEKDIVVTHLQLLDEKKSIHTISLHDESKKFIIAAYQKAKNFVAEATFNGVTFKSGELVAFRLDGNFNSDANIGFDMIKSIREFDLGYSIDLMEHNELTFKYRKDETPQSIRKIDIMFSGTSETDLIVEGQEFNFRTCKVVKTTNAPHPYFIRDHLSGIVKGKVKIDAIVFKADVNSHYGYRNRNERNKTFFIDYTLEKEGYDSEEFSIKASACHAPMTDEKIELHVSLPEYIQLASDDFMEEIPLISESEMCIIGDRAFQTISSERGRQQVPFKLMRDTNGETLISTIDDRRKAKESMFFKPSLDHLKSCINDVDGTLVFKVRDLFEAGSEREYIKFKVGDEVMLASDWSPDSVSPPSIKKIYDFITLEDRSDVNVLSIGNGVNSDSLTAATTDADASAIKRRYKKYAQPIESIGLRTKNDPLHSGMKAPKGILYAIIIDENNELTFHPMIDSDGRHLLNGISHVKKEIGDLKAGDFIKADVAAIPYFAKKNVDEIVSFVNINGRDLCILKSGYTMWHDIIEKCFKVFHRDKLTATKVEFYENKTRQPEWQSFMLLYGDIYFSHIGLPILTRHDAHMEDSEAKDEYRVELFKSAYESGMSTRSISKDTYDRLRTENDCPYFETFVEANSLAIFMAKMDRQGSSFRIIYDSHKCLGASNADELSHSDHGHIGFIGQGNRLYDICYSLDNRSLTNGAAYMELYKAFREPLHSYSYYSSPYKVSKDWISRSHITTAMLTFPTPRMLKKSTRKPKSYSAFKLIGPQNRFYNPMPYDTSSSKMRHTMKNDQRVYNIISDNIFPEMEE
jgi:hypothetical protein